MSSCSPKLDPLYFIIQFGPIPTNRIVPSHSVSFWLDRMLYSRVDIAQDGLAQVVHAMVRELRWRFTRVVVVADDAKTLELMEKGDRVSDRFAVSGVGQDDSVATVWNECVELGFTLVRLKAVVGSFVYTDRYWVSKWDRKRQVCVWMIQSESGSGGYDRLALPLDKRMPLASADTRQKYVQRTSASAAPNIMDLKPLDEPFTHGNWLKRVPFSSFTLSNTLELWGILYSTIS